VQKVSKSVSKEVIFKRHN